MFQRTFDAAAKVRIRLAEEFLSQTEGRKQWIQRIMDQLEQLDFLYLLECAIDNWEVFDIRWIFPVPLELLSLAHRKAIIELEKAWIGVRDRQGTNCVDHGKGRDEWFIRFALTLPRAIALEAGYN